MHPYVSFEILSHSLSYDPLVLMRRGPRLVRRAIELGAVHGCTIRDDLYGFEFRWRPA